MNKSALKTSTVSPRFVENQNSQSYDTFRNSGMLCEQSVHSSCATSTSVIHSVRKTAGFSGFSDNTFAWGIWVLTCYIQSCERSGHWFTTGNAGIPTPFTSTVHFYGESEPTQTELTSVLASGRTSHEKFVIVWECLPDMENAGRASHHYPKPCHLSQWSGRYGQNLDSRVVCRTRVWRLFKCW